MTGGNGVVGVERKKNIDVISSHFCYNCLVKCLFLGKIFNICFCSIKGGS